MINEFIKVIDVISIVILKVINVDYEKRIECRVKNEVLRELLSIYVILNV